MTKKKVLKARIAELETFIKMDAKEDWKERNRLKIDNTFLLARALKAERMVERMIPAGNILLNQNGTENHIVELAEICWRAAVKEWEQ